MLQKMEIDPQMVNKAAQKEMELSEEMCRLCGKMVPNYVPIFDNNSFIVEKINNCLPIVIHASDKLPSNICTRCLHYLNISYKLVVNSAKVDSLLRETLKSTNPDKKTTSQTLQKSSSLISRSKAKVLLKKLKKTAADGPMVCEMCNVLFTDMNAFDVHMETTHLLAHCCNFCEANFSSSDELTAHKDSKHRENTVKYESSTEGVESANSWPEEPANSEVIEHSSSSLSSNSTPRTLNQPAMSKASRKSLPNIIRFRNAPLMPNNAAPVIIKSTKLVPLNSLNLTTKLLSVPSRTQLSSLELEQLPSTSDAASKVLPARPASKMSSSSASAPTLKLIPSNAIISKPSSDSSNAVTSNSAPTLKILLPKSSRALSSNATTFNILPSNFVSLGSNLPVVPSNAKIMIPRMAGNAPKFKDAKPKKSKVLAAPVERVGTNDGEDSDDSLDMPLQPAPTATNVSGCSYYLRCPICGVAVDDDEQLNAHQNVHAPRTMKCKFCQTVCGSVHELYTHKRTQHSLYKRVLLKFACQQCGKFFTNSWQWESHEENKCKEKFPTFPCKYCDAGFTTSLKLKRHLRKHKNDILDDPEAQVFKCVACPKVFTDEEFYQKHRNVHDPECWDKFKCELCNRSFRDRTRLKEHQESIHDGIKPYKCDICGVAFHRRSNMKSHREKHFGYDCEHCNEHFEKLNVFISHLQNVHEIEPSPKLMAKKQYRSGCFVCRFCGKKLCTSQSLIDHEHIHTGQKPHVCKICGKTFRSYTARWAHVQRHKTGSFTCEHCGKTFSYKQNLTSHIMIHMPVEDRKHQCETCGKKFLRRGHLNIHQRIHSGLKPYQCDKCYARFTQMGDMKRHRARHDNNLKPKKDQTKVVAPETSKDLNVEIDFIANEVENVEEMTNEIAY